LKIEIRSHCANSGEDVTLQTGYIPPGMDKTTFFDLDNWSPLSEDELGTILAERIGVVEVEIQNSVDPLDAPSAGGAGESGISEESLKSLMDCPLAPIPPVEEKVQEGDMATVASEGKMVTCLTGKVS
jgi:hypothetical protein